jgi:eukaryotic-like serine/threonine-protein kinase
MSNAPSISWSCAGWAVIGQQIGSYRIVGKIGEGGMGAVYLAEHGLIGRRAAVKVLLPWLNQRAEAVDRFFAEARAMASVGDAGVVQVYDFGRAADGSAYIVMELLEGEALDARLHRVGRLAVIDALRIARQVATTLAAAHGRGIVHRDLKPENVFLVRDAEAENGERPKILDFGIAKLAEGGGLAKTRTGSVIGTPLYMSPEQCRGAGSVDHRSDIYSLGCLLFQLLTGRAPFDGEGPGDLLVKHLTEEPAAPSAVAQGIPLLVDELVLRCLAKDPAARHGSAGELAAAIAAVQARLTGLDRLMAPVLASPAAPPTAVTTLGASAGQIGGTHPGGASGTHPGAMPVGGTQQIGRRRRGLAVALGGAAIAAAVAVTLVVAGGRGSSGAPAAAPAAPAAPVAPVAAAAAPIMVDAGAIEAVAVAADAGVADGGAVLGDTTEAAGERAAPASALRTDSAAAGAPSTARGGGGNSRERSKRARHHGRAGTEKPAEDIYGPR